MFAGRIVAGWCFTLGLTRGQVMSVRYASFLVGSSLVVSAALVVLAGCGSKTSGSSTGSSASGPASTSAPTASLADVVQRVKSGVVRIEARVCSGGSTEQAIGTGFLVAPKLVATVEHVVNGAGRIVVKQNGKKLATATVIGQDADRDLALLRLAKPVKGYVFELTEISPRLGDEVAALGFPFGLPLTLTRGTVSGLNRTIPIENVKRRRLVQTDAAVNEGNSGGPLLRADTGEVIGLVDLGGNANVHGIAFAVSSQVAAPLLHAWRVAPQPVSLRACNGGAPPVQAQGGSERTVRAFVNALDQALIESANTRADLGQLINEVQQGSITADEARSRIDSVINQRNDLRSAVEQVTPPSQFSYAFSLLQKSIVLSLNDDLAIRDWIDDLINGDQAAADSDWQRQLALSSQASRAKSAFLSAYNQLRARLLHLQPLAINY
jgi:S1-C subfamily serine protease